MQIIMPKLGLTMTHGTITEWLKQPGDWVQAEEALCTYETEKVTLELPAPEDGVLVEILVPAGTTVPVGTPVCEFRTAGEQGSGVRGQGPVVSGQAGISTQSAVRNTQHGMPLSNRQPPTANRQPLTATPKARALARQLGVDLSSVTGSGPAGRVQARDVEAAHAAGQPPTIKATPLARRIAAAEGIDLTSLVGTGPEGTITREDVERKIEEGRLKIEEGRLKIEEGRLKIEEGRLKIEEGRLKKEEVGRQVEPSSVFLPESSFVPHSALRRTIAERMTQSAFTAPHVTLFTEAEATNLVSARAQLNQELPPDQKISYNTLLAALAARALREHPYLNARWEADGIRLLAEINIALAVDTERGLMTPVLRNVDKLSLPAIQAGFTELANRALAGKSLPDDFAGGTFTITNLGALDVDGFTPIINPPQAAILGVGRIVEKPVARDGAVVIRPMITLSLSFDHRIVDGAPAAKFLQRIKQLVERPMALLLG